MLPHEKKLVKLLDGKPFALLGINSDGDAATVKKILSEQEITWRQAIDEDTAGPLATDWNIKGWPTIFILDEKGVFRFRDLRDQEMEDAVLKLLTEMES